MSGWLYDDVWASKAIIIQVIISGSQAINQTTSSRSTNHWNMGSSSATLWQLDCLTMVNHCHRRRRHHHHHQHNMKTRHDHHHYRYYFIHIMLRFAVVGTSRTSNAGWRSCSAFNPNVNDSVFCVQQISVANKICSKKETTILICIFYMHVFFKK